MRCSKLLLCWLVVLSFALALGGCVESEQSATDDDDDDNSGGLFVLCGDDASSCGILNCVALGDDSMCTVSCSSDADCQAQSTNACCKETESGKFCAPQAYCGGGDDDDDTVSPDDDDDDDGPCIIDTYRCNAEGQSERCGINGWELYEQCMVGSCCLNGSCQNGYPINEVSNTTVCPGEGDLCVLSQRMCQGSTSVFLCKGSPAIWEYERDCPSGQVCQGGECVEDTGDDDDDGPDCGNEVREGNEECDGNTDSCGETMHEWACVDCHCVEELSGDPCYVDAGCEASDEYCLPEEVGGTQGYCRQYCDMPGESCPRGYSCVNGVCDLIDGYCVSAAQCEQDEICRILDGHTDGLCQRRCDQFGAVCPSRTQCDLDPTSVNYGICVPDNSGCVSEVYCTSDSECTTNVGPNYYCHYTPGTWDGCCMEKCYTNDDCAAGMYCQTEGENAGQCGLGPRPLTCPACATGMICNTLYGMCVPNCPPCPELHTCTAETAPNCVETECDDSGANNIVCGLFVKPCCPPKSCSAVIYGVWGVCI